MALCICSVLSWFPLKEKHSYLLHRDWIFIILLSFLSHALEIHHWSNRTYRSDLCPSKRGNLKRLRSHFWCYPFAPYQEHPSPPPFLFLFFSGFGYLESMQIMCWVSVLKKMFWVVDISIRLSFINIRLQLRIQNYWSLEIFSAESGSSYCLIIHGHDDSNRIMI